MNSNVKATSPKVRTSRTLSVSRVERKGEYIVYHAIDAQTGRAVVRKMKARTDVKAATVAGKRRRDMFRSPSLPESLGNAFKAAVSAARKRYA